MYVARALADHKFDTIVTSRTFFTQWVSVRKTIIEHQFVLSNPFFTSFYPLIISIVYTSRDCTCARSILFLNFIFLLAFKYIFSLDLPDLIMGNHALITHLLSYHLNHFSSYWYPSPKAVWGDYYVWTKPMAESDR